MGAVSKTPWPQRCHISVFFKINLKLAWSHSLAGWQDSGKGLLLSLYPHYMGSCENLGFPWPLCLSLLPWGLAPDRVRRCSSESLWLLLAMACPVLPLTSTTHTPLFWTKYVCMLNSLGGWRYCLSAEQRVGLFTVPYCLLPGLRLADFLVVPYKRLEFAKPGAPQLRCRAAVCWHPPGLLHVAPWGLWGKRSSAHGKLMMPALP